jgi:hypothetical protein
MFWPSFKQKLHNLSNLEDLADVIDKAELYLMPGGHQAHST